MIRKYRRERCSLSNIEAELERFLEIGVLGGCGDMEAVIHPEKDGFVSLGFRDSRITDVPEGKLISRSMMAGKRKFLVRSFFPAAAHTPTARLVEYIEIQEKKNKIPFGDRLSGPDTVCLS